MTSDEQEGRNLNPRNVISGLVKIVAGAATTAAGVYVTITAGTAPILDKPFEPAQLIPYGLGAVGLIMIADGFYLAYNGARTLRDNNL